MVESLGPVKVVHRYLTGHLAAAAGDPSAHGRFTWLLGDLGNERALAERRSRADAGDEPAQDRLAEFLAARGDEGALAELQTRADTGSWYTQCVLAKVFAARGGDDAIAELRALVLTGEEDPSCSLPIANGRPIDTFLSSTVRLGPSTTTGPERGARQKATPSGLVATL